MRLATSAIASSAMPGVMCMYESCVIAVELCPITSETTFRSSELSDHILGGATAAVRVP